MTIQINLPPEMAERLHEEAKRRGEADESVVVRLLDRALPPVPPDIKNDTRSLTELIEEWKREDELLTDEELAENEQIFRNIDAERPEGQKLFTDILKSERE